MRSFVLGMVLLLAGVSAIAEEVYTATLTSAGGLRKRTAEITLTITSRTTPEEAAELQKILQDKDRMRPSPPCGSSTAASPGSPADLPAPSVT